MSERVVLRPAREGLRVPDPDHGGLPLPPEGRELELSSYWRRRIADGDVVRAAPAEKAAQEAPRAARPERPAKS